MRTDFLLYRHPDDVLLAVQGGVFTLLLILISALSLKVFKTILPLSWVSLTGIFLWPRWSNAYLTPVLITFLGLIADMILGNFIGLSSIIFLIFFWLVKPTQRENRQRLLKSWFEFSFAAVIILFSSFFVIGRVIDVPVGWVSLSQQVLIALALYPLIFGLRGVFRKWLINSDDINYQ